MFFINLKLNPENKHIINRDIKNLLNCRITFDVPKPMRQISQCAICQRYGHTMSFCYRKPRCMKCAKDHPSNCPRIGRSENTPNVCCVEEITRLITRTAWSIRTSKKLNIHRLGPGR